MPSSIDRFESIAHALARLSQSEPTAQPILDTPLLHAFDTRNIHPSLPNKVKTLFDDGHYPEATFHAFKYLDKYVQTHSGMSQSGFKLMMAAFNEDAPKLQLTPLKTESEMD